MEEFSQSRGDDDLFDDEIIPIEQSSQVNTESVAEALDRVSLDAAKPKSQPQQQSTPTQSQSAIPPSNRSHGRGRGGPSLPRGSIRGGAPRQQGAYAARGGGHGLSESKWSTKPAPQKSLPLNAEEKKQEPAAEPSPQPEPAVTAAAAQDAPPSDAPTGPAAKARPPAVRGDRSSTGGFAIPKLTEEELTAKLAAAKQKAVDLSAAHARAQADADEFEERERVAGARRRREEGERKKMEGEREKNRARKLGAREGREWDRDKEEQQAGARGYAPRPRPGDEEQQDLSIYEWNEDRGGGRGRGGRGRGRGRGGRGGRGGPEAPGARSNHQQQPNLNAAEDFPALPGRTAPQDANVNVAKEGKPPPLARLESDKLDPGKSWADQMET